MPCPHYRIKISSRKNGQSTVAQAAYQSGDRLYDERDHKTKYYREKRGIEYTEIILPDNAPAEYSDRNTLWNAVEAAEPNWNSQLARRFEIALPVELSLKDSIDLIRQHCIDQFVSKGMIADIAIHDPDPPGHNPHAHVMLTMRPMDKDGRWMEKAHKEYVLDDNGERIRTPSGSWKTRKVNTTDWNDRGNAERWRHEWEVLQNEYLAKAGRDERISMQSYNARGIDQIPMIHMGPVVTALERKGQLTDIGDLNREIRETNKLISSVKHTIEKLISWLSDVRLSIEEIESSPQEIYLAELLLQKFDERKQDRLQNWDSRTGIMSAGRKDLKKFAEITAYMQENRILTVSDLQNRITELEAAALPLRQQLEKVNRQLAAYIKMIECLDCRTKYDPIHDEYINIFWKSRKEKYKEGHRNELQAWSKADRYLRKALPGKQPDRQSMLEAVSSLNAKKQKLQKSLEPIQSEMSMLGDISYYVRDLLPELMPDGKSLSPERKEEKRSVLTRLDEKKQISARENAERAAGKGDIEKCITRMSR